MRIIVRVRELRKYHNLTQEELAKKLNISRQSLISLEQGRWLPSLPLAIQLAQFFNTPLEDVIASGQTPLTGSINQESETAQAQDFKKGKEQSMSSDLAPWSPFRELRDMRNEMDRMFDSNHRFPFGMTTIFPTINLRADADTYFVEAHVPGFSEDDLDIDVSDELVTITGQVKNEAKEADEASGYLRKEYSTQAFSRSLPLPSAVLSEQASAKVSNGVLTVTLPKVREEKPKAKRLKPTAE